MSCKLTPWGAAATVRNLSIRTRRPATSALRVARPEQRSAQCIPFLIMRRGLSDDIYSRQPPERYSRPPPPVPSNSSPQPTAEGGEYAPKPVEIFAPNFLNAEAIAALEKAASGQDIYDEGQDGLLFDMPERPGKNEQLQNRYHPVLDQVTKLLMRDGKLSRAQRGRRGQFATRFAQEIVAVVEGRSAIWDKRNQIHKLGTAARANLTHYAVVGKKR
ncbi:hypothetical protein K449DRAFT_389474 [Hypoxylon sp. EC38]|nr:hypothetical protein K449DRAFT_389474 [Hypoxylon sp. EC38]